MHKVEHINVRIWINENDYLTSLEGFGAPSTIQADTTVVIEDNPLLSICAVETVCNKISSNLPIEVPKNATRCIFIKEIEEICQTVATEIIPTNTDFFIF